MILHVLRSNSSLLETSSSNRIIAKESFINLTFECTGLAFLFLCQGQKAITNNTILLHFRKTLITSPVSVMARYHENIPSLRCREGVALDSRLLTFLAVLD